MRRWLALVGAATMMLALLPLAGGTAAAADPDVVPGSYIVVLKAGDPGAVAAEHSRAHNTSVRHVYRHVLRGYAATMSSRAAARISNDPRVDYVDQDRVVATAHHQCGHNRPSPGPCGHITGTVTSSAGSGIEGATVTAGDRSVLTGAQGDYEIRDLTTGEYTVTASASGFESQSKTETVANGVTTTVNFSLQSLTLTEPESGTVSGTVSDAEGPVADATVTVGELDATTDANGVYAIADVPGGTHTVSASKEGYETSTEEVYVDGDVSDVDLTLVATQTSESSYTVPTGVERIFWPDTAVGKTYPGVAIIDTGIALDHADLNVAGGVNCSTGNSYRDGNGHGTHVAGTVGAYGQIVGVAPGAPLYAVRVLNNAGSGSWASVTCGVDWVTANADKVSVANMSLGGSGTAGASCASSSLRQAICNSVTAGVTYVVAAGNSGADAKDFVPAAYPEVITVAAIADFDGKPGGLADPTCRSDSDDTHANFSNYGTATAGQPGHVDITAPGVCIYSTWHSGDGYNTISGTSMSSPHVAGAAALHLSGKPDDGPAQVRNALVGSANDGYASTWKSDNREVPGLKPRLLDVREL